MKYMGSKSRIAKHIVPIIQEYINDNDIKTYIEPFCGGCNVIDKIYCEKRIASDNNPYLIALLKGVTQAIPCDIYPYVDKEMYDDVRSKMDDEFDYFTIGMVGFLASYNGKFFDGGYAGVVHTKAGTVRDYYDEAKRNLEAQIPNLSGVEFECMDYSNYGTDIYDAVFYCDIPYKDTTQYGTSKDFDHDKFWHWAREMSEKNIVIVSECQAPWDFDCIWEQEVNRTISNKKRVKSVEKLFVLKD